MEHRRREPITRAKAGDGTQDVEREDRANWFGKSTEVSPEFVNEIDPPNRFENPLTRSLDKESNDSKESRKKDDKMSEGEPSM